MSKLNKLLLSLATTVAVFTAQAQEKALAKISAIRQKGDMVTVAVTSAKEFYVGNNKHILHIGNHQYDLYDQDNTDGKGMLRFYLPATDFKQLASGTPVYLSYGELTIEDGLSIEDMCKQNFCPCWSVGKLNKNMLK
jgi:hypothetical protein